VNERIRSKDWVKRKKRSFDPAVVEELIQMEEAMEGRKKDDQTSFH